MRKFVFLSCFTLAATLSAQEFKHFTFELGGGFSQPVGNTGRHLDDGWNIRGGAGVNISPFFGVMVETSYNSFGINSFTLNNLGFPNGDVSIFSATLEPIVHLTPRSHFDLYVIGGGGLYRERQEFTQPSTATFTAFDPFFGGFFPVTVPTTQILASYSINKPGVNIGAGFAIGTKWHGKFFAEARYDRVFITGDRHMDFLPVSFGFRF